MKNITKKNYQKKKCQNYKENVNKKKFKNWWKEPEIVCCFVFFLFIMEVYIVCADVTDWRLGVNGLKLTINETKNAKEQCVRLTFYSFPLNRNKMNNYFCCL